jgi:formylglycine-generating enzyme required for sulfatase activity/serine/threonine protein kinase
LLGVGGFGEVWKAHNPRFPGLTVALKFCLDPAARHRLLRHEAAVIERVLRQGKHPGIVELRQAYLDVEPPCLEYEHVAGGDLVGLIQDWQRQGGLPVPAILQVMQRLTEAVAFAHRFDPPIVHRDLKPANILVQRGNGGFRMKIADFGIGGLAVPALLDGVSCTATGHGGLRVTSLVRGAYTPLYASPEQMRGEPADVRDDVHALGVIWYQLLTGDLTIGAPSGRLWAHRLRERGLSEAAVDLLAACVEPRAADRPTDANALAEELVNLAHTPSPKLVPAAPPGDDDLASMVRRTLDHVARVHEQARHLGEQAHDYAAAARLLEEIPEHLRDTRLYQGLCNRRDRAALLDQDIRQSVAAARLEHLWPLVTTLLELQPERDDLRRLLEQLPHPPELKSEITNTIGMRLRLIPAGTCLMGSPPAEMERQTNEGPQHTVEIARPFYIGVYPVTQREYEAVMGRNPSRFHPANAGSPEHPVEQVSWEDASEFCRRLSELSEVARWGRVYRLPTEAEWEYACRAGTTTIFHHGDSLSSRQANFNGHYPYGRAGAGGPYLERTSRVGAYPPNPWGLYDLHGNVWEWCQDWFDDNYYRHSPEKDPQGPPGGERRVLRGGAWYYYGWFCRAAYRYRRRPEERLDSAGLRVVLALPVGTA